MNHRREHINMTTKLAAVLLALGDIPYEDAKQMTAKQIISLYHFDHGVLHGVKAINKFWNLTPRLIAKHRTKTKKDIATVAKVKRVEKRWREFMRAMQRGKKPTPETTKRRCKCGRPIGAFNRSRFFRPKADHDLCRRCWRAERDRAREENRV